MPFGIIGRTGPWMKEVVGFGDRSTRRGPFGGEFGARHCNQWGLYGLRVRQCRDAALFPDYFGQTCDAFEKRPSSTETPSPEAQKNSHQHRNKTYSVPFASWTMKVRWNAVHPAASSRVLGHRRKKGLELQPEQGASLLVKATVLLAVYSSGP